MERGAAVGHVKECGSRGDTGGRGRGRVVVAGVDAAIVGSVHGGHRRVGVRRN